MSFRLMLPATTALFAVAAAPSFAEHHDAEIDVSRTLISESNCRVVSSESPSDQVVSACDGENGWTLYLHDHATYMSLSLEPEGGQNSGELEFLRFGSDGEIINRLQWVHADDTLLGLVVGYGEVPLAGETDGAFNVYSIALKPDQMPSACIMSRVEFGQVRGVNSAARQVITSMADGWDCAEDERIDFSPETINGQPYSQAVHEAARARSGS